MPEFRERRAPPAASPGPCRAPRVGPTKRGDPHDRHGDQTGRTANFDLDEQVYGDNPIEDRDTGHYRQEYVMSFVEKWDELIDWDARARSEGQFFVDVLRARGKETVLDVAAGTGFHSVRLTEAGFNVVTADGNAAMVAKAFENGKARADPQDRAGRLALAEPRHQRQVRRDHLPRQFLHPSA